MWSEYNLEPRARGVQWGHVVDLYIYSGDSWCEKVFHTLFPQLELVLLRINVTFISTP